MQVKRSTTYVAAPAGMTAHHFDDEGTLHSLSIAAWWQDGEQLRPVVVSEEGALRHDEGERAVITGPNRLPSLAALLGHLFDDLQSRARDSAIGQLRQGKLTDDQCRLIVDKLDDRAAPHPAEAVADYLDRSGAAHLSILGLRYEWESPAPATKPDMLGNVAPRAPRVLTITEREAGPTHPALQAADAAKDKLIEQRRVEA